MSYQRDFERRIKVGIIGAGSHCYRNVLPTMNYLPVEIKAICDINEEIAKKQQGNMATVHTIQAPKKCMKRRISKLYLSR